MVLSQKDVDQLLKDLQDNFAAAFATGDASKVAAFYEPNAVIIHTGQKVYFGIGAGNGEYLIQRGFFEMNLTGHVKHPYEQIFKRQSDGHYLITRDEFDM
uniref:Nuclear transport factor 2 family protein n=1 Tax=Acrobeloides nanus TaxID=290746 RepID=A0A914C4R3_9BILA